MTIPKCRPYVETGTVISKASTREVVREAIAEKRIYRGCAWTLQTSLTGDVDLAAFAAMYGPTGKNISAYLAHTRQVPRGTVTAAATQLILSATILLPDYRALDDVPWEVHLIEDEIAYAAALASFLRESRRLR